MYSPQDIMVAGALVDALRLGSASTAAVFAECGVAVTRAEPLWASGMPTNNAGLIITLNDDTEYMVTVTRRR